MLGITAILGIGLFFLLPLVVATFTAGNIENDLVQHFVEGLVRVVIFIGYLAVISRTPDIARVFQYHGAEHMTIHALEADKRLVPEEVRKFPTAHPRCGTEFLVVVIMLSIIAFSLVGRQSPLRDGREPHRPDPGDRRRGLRDPPARGAPPRQPGREGDHVAGDPRPEDHHQAADGRHDRGRDRAPWRRPSRPTARRSRRAAWTSPRDPMPEPGETAAAVRAMAEAEGDEDGHRTATKAAEGEAVAPVSIDPPLAG